MKKKNFFVEISLKKNNFFLVQKSWNFKEKKKNFLVEKMVEKSFNNFFFLFQKSWNFFEKKKFSFGSKKFKYH